ncbi:MAG: hypothetical protein K8T10_13980 [Candidatus Eremiobacteraeota bacterium]|nr:hypothetical protein [Candidatus Eremiobacteraeota bacterium]
MKTLLFAPLACNLAEVTRAIDMAKACKDNFNILFQSYGGDFEKEIIKEGFEVRKLSPQMTPERVEKFWKVDKGESFSLDDFFTVDELTTRVESELALYEEVKPAAVVTGFCLSVPISTRVAGVPLVWVIQSTWIKQYYESGMATCPDVMDFSILRFIPDHIMDKLSEPIMEFIYWAYIGTFNKTAKKFGVKPYETMFDLWDCEHVLLAEPPGFSGLKDLPSNYHYIGPLVGKLDMEVPEEILNMPKDMPIVYFAMGSSGTHKIVAKILEGFEGQPFRVISPVKALVEKLNVNVPSNVIATGWLPAHKVNPMADISVIHGGIGTVMTACLAGLPVVGVGMQPEQEANLECLVRKGFAIRIKKKRLSSEKINEDIKKLLKDEDAKRKAKEFQKEIEKWDDPNKITEFFVRTFK